MTWLCSIVGSLSSSIAPGIALDVSDHGLKNAGGIFGRCVRDNEWVFSRGIRPLDIDLQIRSTRRKEELGSKRVESKVGDVGFTERRRSTQ